MTKQNNSSKLKLYLPIALGALLSTLTRLNHKLDYFVSVTIFVILVFSFVLVVSRKQKLKSGNNENIVIETGNSQLLTNTTGNSKEPWPETSAFLGKTGSRAVILAFLLTSVLMLLSSVLAVVISIRKPDSGTLAGLLGVAFFGYGVFRSTKAYKSE